MNGALVLALFKLKALEAVPVMEAAYQAKTVDEMFIGSWARVQADLGLKQTSDFTPEKLSIASLEKEQKEEEKIGQTSLPVRANGNLSCPRHPPRHPGLPSQNEAAREFR